ncbi:uncharacterized protein TNCV_5021111 [Trichonephila clavipes]|nr:uncharacterized protein TNCV_5021111 [Trichonephila clavipes]
MVHARFSCGTTARKIAHQQRYSLTPSVEGLSNITKYPGCLPDIAFYDGNPRNQGLVGVKGACVNKTLHMSPEEEV